MKKILLEITENELKFLVRLPTGFLQHVPHGMAATYSGFTKEEIQEFSKKMRTIMDENDVNF